MAGHGRDALARTTFIRYTLRAYLEAGLEPREVLKVGSAALADHLAGGFVTVAVAVHEPGTGASPTRARAIRRRSWRPASRSSP